MSLLIWGGERVRAVSCGETWESNPISGGASCDDDLKESAQEGCMRRRGAEGEDYEGRQWVEGMYMCRSSTPIT